MKWKAWNSLKFCIISQTAVWKKTPAYDLHKIFMKVLEAAGNNVMFCYLWSVWFVKLLIMFHTNLIRMQIPNQYCSLIRVQHYDYRLLNYEKLVYYREDKDFCQKLYYFHNSIWPNMAVLTKIERNPWNSFRPSSYELFYCYYTYINIPILHMFGTSK